MLSQSEGRRSHAVATSAKSGKGQKKVTEYETEHPKDAKIRETNQEFILIATKFFCLQKF